MQQQQSEHAFFTFLNMRYKLSANIYRFWAVCCCWMLDGNERFHHHGHLPLTSLPLSALSSSGGLSLWLVVWLVLGKPSPASACPHHCVCYPTPMTVSCQAQNFTAVPVGVPYESQRVFLQNNRIMELRVGSFGFGTQVRHVS